MEERKRNLQDYNDAPPSKKQATAANSTGKKVDSEAPWNEDLEKFQKDALLRQLQEYKRERKELESALSQLRKQARDHDDHIRTIDAWFRQLVDEIRIQLPDGDTDGAGSLASALHFRDQEKFNNHLERHAAQIQALVSKITSHTQSVSPELSDLQSKLVKLLAVEKEHITEVEKLQFEVQDLDERLQNATQRYMVAEKKLDRARSNTIARFEKGLLLGGAKEVKEESKAIKEDEKMTNGVTEHEDTTELENEIKRITAVYTKQQAQISQLEADNTSLTTKLTALSNQSGQKSDEDFAKTELFKLIKIQHDEAVKRLNDLTASNAEIKDENERLQSTRTDHETQVEDEGRKILADKDTLLAQVNADLVRIRNHRDELLADQAVKKSALDERMDSMKRLRELQAVGEDRIRALEAENQRMQSTTELTGTASGLDELSPDDMKTKIRSLEGTCTNWQAQLGSMEEAYNKVQKLAKQNVADFQALEEKTARLSAEKAKADQKYFSAMRSKEARDVEVRTLRMQTSKSADIIEQLKEAELASRGLLASLEKQLQEVKVALNTKTSDCFKAQGLATTQAAEMAKFRGQIDEVQRHLSEKDARVAAAASTSRQIEQENEGLKSRLEEAQKHLELWKSKSGQNEQYEFLRSMAYCTVCKKELKNTVIKTCGHTFCHGCVEKVVQLRSRKCPNCGKPFGASDHMRITL